MLVCLALVLASLFGCGNASVGGGAVPAKPPTANIAGPYTGQVGAAVSFNGSASSDPNGQALSFVWSFGDGASGTGDSPAHTYASAGTYTVSLVVTDTSGLSSPAAKTTAVVIPAQDLA